MTTAEKEELEQLRNEKDELLKGLERLGWPVSLFQLPDYCMSLTNELLNLKNELQNLKNELQNLKNKEKDLDYE